MSNKTEFLPLDEAAALLKVSVNSLLNQAMEGLLQIYWLLNKTLYSDTLELQPVGEFPAYYGQDIEEWSTNLSAVPSSKHFTFIPLYREKAGDLLTKDSTECWVSEISTPEETFSLAEPEAFTITRQHLALVRKDVEDWDKPSDQCCGQENELPDFDAMGQSQTTPNTTRATKATTTCQHASAAKIKQRFRVLTDTDANAKWWEKLMREANRNGLAECRVGGGKTGPGGSLWSPDLVAHWLAERHAKNCRGVASNKVGGMLKQFPGCEEAAEDWFPSDEKELP